MQIKDLLESKPPPVTIRSDQDVPDAMRLLIENQIGSLVVTDEKETPVGIITERDIFHLAFRYRGDMMDMKVGDAMSTHLVIGNPQDEIEKVARIMTDEHIRHLPIMDDREQLCGIVSIGDIVKAHLNQPTS
jgi:CBS domain-containing protein